MHFKEDKFYKKKNATWIKLTEILCEWRTYCIRTAASTKITRLVQGPIISCTSRTKSTTLDLSTVLNIYISKKGTKNKNNKWMSEAWLSIALMNPCSNNFPPKLANGVIVTCDKRSTELISRKTTLTNATYILGKLCLVYIFWSHLVIVLGFLLTLTWKSRTLLSP